MSSSDQTSLKVAIVHDFLREYGGAERVVEALHEIFPQAPLYVAFADPVALGIHWQKFAQWDIKQSWLAKVPFHEKLFSPMRIFAPAAFKRFDLAGYDVVISSSNAYFAKAVQVKKPTLHICYCHTPPRALYGYSTMTNWKKNPVIKVAGTLINHVCRVMDVHAAQGVDLFIANSKEVKKRIQKFYRRESMIIHPPVDVPTQAPKRQTGQYFLYVNRLAFAKHPELAVAVATELNLPLKVVGSGKVLPTLQQHAGPTVEFLGSVSDQTLHQLYEGARALLYPVEDEDFGIVPVEAMGHGVPVIAHRSGGPLETITDQTGIFFDDLTVAGLKAAVKLFIKNEKKFQAQQIYLHAKTFSKSEFQRKVVELVTSSVAQQS